VLGPPLDGDERFAMQSGRLAHREEVEAAVTAALSAHPSEHWLEVLSQAGIAVGRVTTLPEAVARHRADSRTGLRAVHGSTIEVLAPAVSFGDEQWPPLSFPGEADREVEAVR
jgi:crotonobetainyl-CoA:carnitine CoA-transferase CaiB-like acyl-CoA transferase